MNKVILTFALSLLSFAGVLKAQEVATYSQYQVFPILFNPGVTGFSGNHEVLINARKTAMGFTGTPTTYTAMYHGSLGDKLGLGALVFSEKTGNLTTTKLQGNYAFRFRLQKAQIGLGLTTEFLTRRINQNLLSDGSVEANDPVLEDYVDGQQIFDATAGVHVLYDNRLFVGLSLPNTVRVRLDQQALGSVPTVEQSAQRAYYFFNFGYIFSPQAADYKLIPSIAIRSVRDVPYQVDLNLQARVLQDRLIAGLTFRPGENGVAAFMIGTQYKKAQVLYSYDIGFGSFQQHNAGSHELTLAYAFSGRKPQTVTPAPGDYQ